MSISCDSTLISNLDSYESFSAVAASEYGIGRSFFDFITAYNDIELSISAINTSNKGGTIQNDILRKVNQNSKTLRAGYSLIVR